MNVVWRELNPNDSWVVCLTQPLQTVEIGWLMHLYQPIVGVEAVSLYITLCMQGSCGRANESTPQTHRLLMTLLNLPLDKVLDARHRLEGIGLLKAFKREEEFGRSFRYELLPPLEPSAFFQTDVLCITLMNRLGKERFRQVREHFIPDESDRTDAGEDVTKRFYEVFTSILPSELTIREERERQAVLAELETAATHEAASGPSFADYPLDWDFLRSQASAAGTLDHLTDAEREQIQAWAFFYRLDEMGLGKALQNPQLYNAQNELQLDRLHTYIKQEYRFHHGRELPTVTEKEPRERLPRSKGRDGAEEGGRSPEEVHRKWLAKLSPLELLERYHRGGKVPEADVKLVEELYEKYSLPYGVINVLIEFVLRTNDYKLPRALVEKMAGHWRRANVQTVRQAQEFALKQLSRPKHKRQGQRRDKPPSHTKQTHPSRSRQPSEAAETEEKKRQRQAKFEELLGKIREAREKGE